MDSGTATHPPCPMCDPSILPEGYSPTPGEPEKNGLPSRRSVMIRPNGEKAYMRGAAKVYLNSLDVTNQVKDVDVERGVIVAYHRVMGQAFVSRKEYAEGIRPGDKPPEMVRHFCNRQGLDQFDPRLGAGLGVDGHACMTMLRGEVLVIDKATGEAPVYWEPEDVGSSV